MTNINGDVEQGKTLEHYQAAAAKLHERAQTARHIRDEDLRNPAFCRHRMRQMAEELDAAHMLVNAMAKAIAARDTELARYTPTPEIRRAMTIRTGAVHSIAVTVDGRDHMVTVPADGFDDPDRTYRGLVQVYGDRR